MHKEMSTETLIIKSVVLKYTDLIKKNVIGNMIKFITTCANHSSGCVNITQLIIFDFFIILFLGVINVMQLFTFKILTVLFH